MPEISSRRFGSRCDSAHPKSVRTDASARSVRPDWIGQVQAAKAGLMGLPAAHIPIIIRARAMAVRISL
jgi:hypothetical protein